MAIITLSVTLRAQNYTGGDFLRARTSIENGKYGLAIQICNEALASGSDYRYLLLRAEAFLGSGEVKNALSDFAGANQIVPFSGDYGMATCYSVTGNSDLAVACLERHLQSPFKKSERDILLDPAFNNIETSDPWKRLWKKNWYTQLEKGLSEVEYLVENGRLSEAREVEERLRSVYSDKPGLYYIQGIVRMAEGNEKDAIFFFKRSIDEGFNSIDLWSDYIDCLMTSGNFSSAAVTAIDAISSFPEEPSLLIRRAEALRLMGDRSKAVETIDYFLDIFPDDEEAIKLAGQVSYEIKAYPESLRYFSRNIANHPGNPECFNERARVYYATGSWEFAVSDYSMSLDLDPVNGEIWYLKGLTLLKMGRNREGCRDLKMALKYGFKKASAEISRNCIK